MRGRQICEFKNVSKIINIIALLKKIKKLQILNFVKSSKIKNSRKFKDAKITRSTVFLVQWLKLLAWKVGDREFKPRPGLQVSKKHNVSSPHTRNYSMLRGNLRDRKVASSASDCQGSVISFISPSSGGSPGPCSLVYKTPFISFLFISFHHRVN